MIRPEQAFFLEAQSPYSKARHAGHLCLLVGMHRVTLGSIRVADFPSPVSYTHLTLPTKA